MKQQEPDQLKCWCLNVQQTRSQRKGRGLFTSHLLETVYKQAGRRLVSSAGESKQEGRTEKVKTQRDDMSRQKVKEIQVMKREKSEKGKKD